MKYALTLLFSLSLLSAQAQDVDQQPWYAFVKCKALIEQQKYDSAIYWADTGMTRAETAFGRTTDEFVFFLHNKELALVAADRKDQVESLYEAYYEELKDAPTDSALIRHLEIKTLSEMLRKIGVEEILRTMTLMKSKLGRRAQNMALNAYQNPEADSRRWTTILAFIDLGGDFQRIDEETRENESIFANTPLESKASDVFRSIGFLKKAKKTKDTLKEHNNPEDSVERPKIGLRRLFGTSGTPSEATARAEPLTPQFANVDFTSLTEAQKDSFEVVMHAKYNTKRQQRDTAQSLFSNVLFATTALSTGVFYESIGRITQADTCFAQANEGFHNYMNGFSLLVGQEERMRSVADFYAFSNYANSFVLRHHGEHPAISGLAYNNILLEKGLLLEKNRFMQKAVTTSDDPYLLRVYDLWIDAKNIIAATDTEALIDDHASDYTDSVNHALQELKKELNRQTQFKDQQPWMAIRENLSADDAVVEFLHFPYYAPGALQQDDPEEQTTSYDSIYYVAVVMRTQDEYPHIVPLCKEADITELLRGGESQQIAGQLYRGAGAVSTTLSKGAQLYDLIWKPIEPLLNETKTIYFSPAGQLHKIAFAGLPSPGAPLAEKYQLHHLSSTRLLAYGTETAPVNTETAALFGDIDFDAKPDELLALAESENMASYGNAFTYESKDKERWEELSGTQREVEAIAELLNAQQTHYGYYTRGGAMEERFRMLGDRRSKSPAMVHVATHGFFLPEPKPKKAKRKKDENEDHYDPTLALRRSGLVFAGGNNGWMGNKNLPEHLDDGILLAAEAAQMSLQNTDLVVLSACETGLGDIRNSEGVYGLQRAMREAGVRYLMMSLWKINDEVAQFIMQRFYSLLINEQQSVRLAFSQAQRETRQQFKNRPGQDVDWAAFTLVE